MPKYFVPNMCATIPLVAGTVDSHKKPKLAPKINALTLVAGKNINRIIDKPLKEYITLKIIFLLILVERYPLNKEPKILNSPISDKIAAEECLKTK